MSNDQNLGPSMIELVWRELDSRYEEFVGSDAMTRSTTDTAKLSQEMRGIAIALVHFTRPYQSTIKEISQEVKRRYEARKRGDENYRTPTKPSDLTDEKYELVFGKPRTGADATTTKSSTPARRRPSSATAPSAGPVVSASEKEGIRLAVEQKILTIEQIAQMYRKTPDQIRAIVSEEG